MSVRRRIQSTKPASKGGEQQTQSHSYIQESGDINASGDKYELLLQPELWLKQKYQLDDGHQSPALSDASSDSHDDNSDTKIGRDEKENKVDTSSINHKLRIPRGRLDKPRRSGDDVGIGGHVAADTNEEQKCWVQDVLVGQQAGHLAHLIGLLPFKLFSDIHDTLEVSMRSSLNGVAASDLSHNLDRRMRCRRRIELEKEKEEVKEEYTDSTDANCLTARRTSKMLRIVRHQYIDSFHRNLDKCELWSLRNVFTSRGNIPLGGLLHAKGASSSGSSVASISDEFVHVSKEEHYVIDAEIAELRQKLVRKKLELERNRMRTQGDVSVENYSTEL